MDKTATNEGCGYSTAAQRYGRRKVHQLLDQGGIVGDFVIDRWQNHGNPHSVFDLLLLTSDHAQCELRGSQCVSTRPQKQTEKRSEIRPPIVHRGRAQ